MGTSIDVAEKNIDYLASKNEVDPALLLIISKTYSSVKESSYAKTTVAEVISHIYFKSQEILSKAKPYEIRILKHLLTLEDPIQIEIELEKAITPGPNFESETHEYIFTNRDKLLNTINVIIRTYQTGVSKTSLLGLNIEKFNPIVI